MTRRAPVRPDSKAARGVSLRRKPIDSAEADAPFDETATAEIEELGPLHPDPAPHAAKPAQTRDPRKTLALTVVGLLCAVGAAAGVGKAMNDQHRGGLGPVPAHADTPAAPAPEAKPILADYRPPDRDQVRKAYLNVASVYKGEGLSGVVRQTIDCFDTLKQSPGYEMLDYCIALDAFGGALDHQLDHEQPAQEGYFAGAGVRDLAAAKVVVGADGDAGARVVDVKRLAGEVSQDGPDAARKAIASLSTAGPQGAVEVAPGAPAGRTQPLRRPQTLTIASAPQPKPAPVKAAVETKPVPVKVAAAKAPPSRIQTVKAAAVKPAPHAEKHAAPRPAFQHPRLQRASTPTHHAKPVLEKASVKAHAKPAPHRPLRIAAKTAPKHEPPHVIRAAAHAWASLAHAVKTSLHPAKPAPTLADRRGEEPAEWIDCRRPRTLSEQRICEDIDSGGGGTLQGQLSRSKYEPAGH